MGVEKALTMPSRIVREGILSSERVEQLDYPALDLSALTSAVQGLDDLNPDAMLKGAVRKAMAVAAVVAILGLWSMAQYIDDEMAGFLAPVALICLACTIRCKQ